MKFILTVVLLVSSFACASEKQNKEKVQYGLKLCKMSGCSPCGYFSQIDEYVTYTQSHCESEWLWNNGALFNKEESDKIIKKYTTPNK